MTWRVHEGALPSQHWLGGWEEMSKPVNDDENQTPKVLNERCVDEMLMTQRQRNPSVNPAD